MKCRKSTYPNRRVAWQYGLFFHQTYGQFSSPYKCPNCKKFHLTTRIGSVDAYPDWYADKFNQWFGIDILPHVFHSIKTDISISTEG
jgi:hypothetical protein